MNFDRVYEAFLNLDNSKKVSKGQKALQNLLLELKAKGQNDLESAKNIKSIIATFTGADKIIQLEEHKFFNDIFNSDITSTKFMNHMNKELENNSIEKVDNLIDSLSENGKANACTLGLCFLVSDGILTEEEKQAFEKIIG